MRKIVLYSACSLDSFIARKDNSIDWLFMDGDYGYEDFHQTIDTTLMGHNTYQVVMEMGEFPYKGSKNYVFSRNENVDANEHVTFIHHDVVQFVQNLKTQPGKNIWLVGGGQVNTLLLNYDLIDEMILGVHPTVLGDGIPLFAPTAKERRFELVSSKSYENGLLLITYQKQE